MNLSRRPRASERATAALEFALVAPLLLVLIIGGFDLAMWLRAAYRLDEATNQMAELISRCNAINDPADIDNFFAEAVQIADPVVIDTQTGGALIISAMGMSNNQPTVLWQKREGNPTFSSHFGIVGQKAITGAYAISGAEVLIGTETFSSVQPWTLSPGLLNLGAVAPLYAQSMFLVRSGSANQLASLGTGALPACNGGPSS